jgi:hypothetical protein
VDIDPVTVPVIALRCVVAIVHFVRVQQLIFVYKTEKMKSGLTIKTAAWDRAFQRAPVLIFLSLHSSIEDFLLNGARWIRNLSRNPAHTPLQRSLTFAEIKNRRAIAGQPLLCEGA